MRDARNRSICVAVLALLVTAFVGAAPAAAQNRPYYPQAAYDLDHDYPVVELVTMGIGSLIWERHGHLALCVVYEDVRQDACYNYGVGDFHEPLAMAWGFLRGTHSFWVDKEIPNRMLAIYRYADRTIWAQPLPLTQPQKAEVIAKLESDIQEENKYYAYDHISDNCTTRIRDVIDHATGGKLAAMTVPLGDRTIRDYVRVGFFGMRMPLLLTDIIMGRTTDHVPSNWELMFLPQFLREAVTKLWNVQPIVIYARVGPPPLDDAPTGRFVFALIIIAATSPVWITRLIGRFQRIGLGFALVPQVLLGIALWVMVIVTPLPYLRWNEVVLVLLPADLLMLILSPARRRTYARGRVIMLGLIAALSIINVFKQPLWATMLWPLIPALCVGFWPPKIAAGKAVVVPTKADDVTTESAESSTAGAKKKQFGKRRAGA